MRNFWILLILLSMLVFADGYKKFDRYSRFNGFATSSSDTSGLPVSCFSVVNCSFNDAGTGWTDWGAPPTREYVNFQGATTLHVVSNSLLQGLYQADTEATSSGTATIHYRVWVANNRVRIIARDGTSGFTGNNVQVTTTGQWVSGTLSFTWPTISVEARIFAESTGTGQDFYVDYLYIVND